MKSFAFALSLLFSAVTAEVQFMMIPSAETRELVESDVCAHEDPDVEVPALVALYALECAVEIVPGEVSFMEDMSTTGAGTEFAGAMAKFDGGRALSEEKEQEHRHLAIDCINDCWIYPKNAPLICCLLCSWCVGSSNGRRELAAAETTKLEGEVTVAKNMNDMISCIEGKFQEKCSEEEGKCIGCDGEGSFTGAVSGFVALS